MGNAITYTLVMRENALGWYITSCSKAYIGS